MKFTLRQSILLFWSVLLLSAIAFGQQIPVGTVLPIMSNRTLDSRKSKPGEKLTGKLMQDIVLPSGAVLHSGTKIEGRVLEASGPPGVTGARLVLRFDYVVSHGKQLPINVSLRALASTLDVFEAQLPVGNFDEYGISSSDWTTVQVGGAAVYRGDGTVRSAMDIVGHATDYGAVTARLVPAPKLGCPATPAESDREQSLWVFSPWACGTYGFDALAIAHHGATDPLGTIVL